MTIDTVVYLGQKAMLVTLLVSAPMLIAGMVVGLLISVFQSVTQVQEITLTFVPKILAVLLAFVIFMPFMMSTVLQFVQELFTGMGQYLG
ncbi:MAG TPA: flagellar biosynthesis protein FliQ [Candidatus Hydrogenedentes bacterium]|nr:flagellar biosynthesis protein FliQ [Candidatus Hydrogenedentota bacterium]HOL76744.1 flagellar biosynthesis protein FliQ [Candidatus Hydrogenedentota bacterium]HPO85295.1 flagellar biosynthesis protein FliQ [Candidatus Hydrogenedentota bacterium]